jgi:hypothetical protein
MTKQTQKFLKENIPYFTKITRKNRYSDVIKDRAWAILSDFCRQRDFIIYGTCISSGRKLADWHDGDAGHFYNMGAHGATLGFSDLNVHLQSKIDNMLSEAVSGGKYRDELVIRYGDGILEQLEAMKRATVKADDWFFMDKIMEVYGKYQELKMRHPEFDYPAYL